MDGSMDESMELKGCTELEVTEIFWFKGPAAKAPPGIMISFYADRQTNMKQHHQQQ